MFNCGSVARKQAVNRRGSPLYQINESEVATKTKNSKLLRKPYTASDIKMLKTHSKARTPVSRLSKMIA